MAPAVAIPIERSVRACAWPIPSTCSTGRSRMKASACSGRMRARPSGFTVFPINFASIRLGPMPQVTPSPVASRIAAFSPRAASSRSPCSRSVPVSSQ